MPNIDLNQLIRAVVAGITPSNLINFNARLHAREGKRRPIDRDGETGRERERDKQEATLWQHFRRKSWKIYIEVELCNLLLN